MSLREYYNDLRNFISDQFSDATQNTTSPEAEQVAPQETLQTFFFSTEAMKISDGKIFNAPLDRELSIEPGVPFEQVKAAMFTSPKELNSNIDFQIKDIGGDDGQIPVHYQNPEDGSWQPYVYEDVSNIEDMIPEDNPTAEFAGLVNEFEDEVVTGRVGTHEPASAMYSVETSAGNTIAINSEFIELDRAPATHFEMIDVEFHENENDILTEEITQESWQKFLDQFGKNEMPDALSELREVAEAAPESKGLDKSAENATAAEEATPMP